MSFPFIVFLSLGAEWVNIPAASCGLSDYLDTLDSLKGFFVPFLVPPMQNLFTPMQEDAMTYQETLNRIHTFSALDAMKLEPIVRGAYVNFNCQCGAKASMKRSDDKKNLWFCPSCKQAGNILSLGMKIKGYSDKDEKGYNEVKKKLLDLTPSDEPLTEELKLNYKLQYELDGLSSEFLEGMGVGIPKGKTMLSGCVAFPVTNGGVKVAYYGIRIKTLKPVYHKSLNPELYLLFYDNFIGRDFVVFVTEPLQALKLIQDDMAVVCNFRLPYLSEPQIKMLNTFDQIEFRTAEKQIMADAVNNITAFYRFSH
jgi:hypothetical protein